MTPFEQAQSFAKNLKATMEIAQALEEIEKMTEEERQNPEVQALIELLTLALSAMMGTVAEG